jgi:hypothetical protein
MIARDKHSNFYENSYNAAVKSLIKLAQDVEACLMVATGTRVVTALRFNDIISQSRALEGFIRVLRNLMSLQNS